MNWNGCFFGLDSRSVRLLLLPWLRQVFECDVGVADRSLLAASQPLLATGRRESLTVGHLANCSGKL